MEPRASLVVFRSGAIFAVIKRKKALKSIMKPMRLYIALNKILEKILSLIENSIFSELSKYLFFPVWPNKAKPGASDVIPGNNML